MKKNNQKEIKRKVLESLTGENSSLKNAAIRKNDEEDVFIELSFTNNSSVNLIITQIENEMLLKHNVRQKYVMQDQNTMYRWVETSGNFYPPDFSGTQFCNEHVS